MPAPWRVAITRDEPADGPLSAALRAAGQIPVICTVAVEAPPRDPSELAAAARGLPGFDWVIFASARAVGALFAHLQEPWPESVRTAAVGPGTARELMDRGVHSQPVMGAGTGADSLWMTLRDKDDWRGRRILIPAVTGGRRTLKDELSTAGATVVWVEAYRMIQRPAPEIAHDWRAAHAHAAIVTSPSAANALAGAVGSEALRALEAVVAMGATTFAALRDLGVGALVPGASDFAGVARFISDLHLARAKSTPQSHG